MSRRIRFRRCSQQPWSNGPVEGQVHRLKLIKRSMYGRAKFDLIHLHQICGRTIFRVTVTVPAARRRRPR